MDLKLEDKINLIKYTNNLNHIFDLNYLKNSGVYYNIILNDPIFYYDLDNLDFYK